MIAQSFLVMTASWRTWSCVFFLSKTWIIRHKAHRSVTLRHTVKTGVWLTGASLPDFWSFFFSSVIRLKMTSLLFKILVLIVAPLWTEMELFQVNSARLLQEWLKHILLNSCLAASCSDCFSDQKCSTEVRLLCSAKTWKSSELFALQQVEAGHVLLQRLDSKAVAAVSVQSRVLLDGSGRVLRLPPVLRGAEACSLWFMLQRRKRWLGTKRFQQRCSFS